MRSDIRRQTKDLHQPLLSDPTEEEISPEGGCKAGYRKLEVSIANTKRWMEAQNCVILRVVFN